MAAAQPLRHGVPELVSESTIWHPGLRVPNLCLEYFLNLSESGCGGPRDLSCKAGSPSSWLLGFYRTLALNKEMSFVTLRIR